MNKKEVQNVLKRAGRVKEANDIDGLAMDDATLQWLYDGAMLELEAQSQARRDKALGK